MNKIFISLVASFLFISPLHIFAESEPVIDKLSTAREEEVKEIAESLEFYDEFISNSKNNANSRSLNGNQDNYGNIVGEIQTVTIDLNNDIARTLFKNKNFDSVSPDSWYYALTDTGNKVIFSKNESGAMIINTLELHNDNVEPFKLPIDTVKLRSIIETNQLNPKGLIYYYSGDLSSFLIYFPSDKIVIPVQEYVTNVNGAIPSWKILSVDELYNIIDHIYDNYGLYEKENVDVTQIEYGKGFVVENKKNKTFGNPMFITAIVSGLIGLASFILLKKKTN